MKQEVINKGGGRFLVLALDGKKYYNVYPNDINKGGKPCECKATKLECEHYKKVVAFMSVR